MKLDTLTARLPAMPRLPRRRPTTTEGATFYPDNPAAPDLTSETDEARAIDPHRLAIRHRHRNLLVAKSRTNVANNDGVWAWFVLTGVDWQMKDAEHHTTVVDDQTARLAELIGHRCMFRGLSVAFPHQAFAERIYRDNPDRLPDVDGARTFQDLVDAMQLELITMDARHSVSLLGVRIATRQVQEHDLPLILGTEPLHQRLGEIDLIRKEYHRVADIVGRNGYGGQPLNATGMTWFLHASVGLMAPVPSTLLTGDRAGWTSDDVAGFTEPVYTTAAPYSPDVTYRTVRELVQHESHVAIVHVDDFEPREEGRLFPFLAWTQLRPYPVEYCAIVDVIDGRDLKQQAERAHRSGRNTAKHHLAHGDTVPAEVERGIQVAAQLEDEVTNGSPEIATRVRGVIMLAVTGATDTEAMARVAELITDAGTQQRMPLKHAARGQYDAARAFIPGEPYPMKGRVTQMSARFFARGVPNATATFGDPTGFPLGQVLGTYEPAIFHMHGGAARDRSNMLGIGGGLGSGKSTLAYALADWSATCGIPTIVLDPSGPAARLCSLPHLKGNALHLPLSSSKAPRGVLNPYRMIFDPVEGDYDDDPDPKLSYRRARAAVESERLELATDTMRDLLPVGMASGDDSGRVHAMIQEAVVEVGGDYGTDPWAVVAHLKGLKSDPGTWITGTRLAASLTYAAQQPIGSLVFPNPHETDIDHGARLLNQAALTVITTEGLTLPPKGQTDRSTWSSQAIASIPVLNLSARFAMRLMYSGTGRKTIILDELGMSTGGASSFSSFAVRASTDSRKLNAFIALVFQNPGMLLRLDPEISNLLGAAMIGRMEDAETARAALALLRLHPESGHHRTIMALRQGQFISRDWGRRVPDRDGGVVELPGRVRNVYVNRAWWHDDLRAALDTNPFGEGMYDETTGGIELTDGFVSAR